MRLKGDGIYKTTLQIRKYKRQSQISKWLGLVRLAGEQIKKCPDPRFFFYNFFSFVWRVFM